MIDERQEFAFRCFFLQNKLQLLALAEPSPRVWVSVLTTILKDVTSKESDPKGCMDQIIMVLQRQEGESEMDSPPEDQVLLT